MNFDSSKWVAILCILAFAGLLYWQDEVLLDEKTGLARVVDGDSLVIGAERIRMKGIDAPEKQQKCEKNGAQWACGRASTTALKRKIGGRAVTCDGGEYDRHQRLLAFCSAGGVELNRWMVAQGWAVSFGGQFKTEERRAKSEKIGIWASKFQFPSDWRRAHPRY